MPRFIAPLPVVPFDLDSFPSCPNCRKVFSTTQGVNAHLSMSKTCCAYKKGKLCDLSLSLPPPFFERTPLPSPSPDHSSDSASPGSSRSASPVDDHFDWHQPEWPAPEDMSDDDSPQDGHDYYADLNHFLREFDRDELELIPTAGDPGPQSQTHATSRRLTRVLSRALLDDEDTRVSERPYPQAGRVLRRISASLEEEQEEDEDGDISMDGSTSSTSRSPSPHPPYHPFASELDWRVAQWAIKETVAQSAFDRFLNIPGLVEKLGLSFDSMKRLHALVDALEDWAGEWTTSHLQFEDDPDIKFPIHYRSALSAIQSLFKNPRLKEHLVYSPVKVFSNSDKKNRIYSEMWTAKWWHLIQHQLPAHATVAPVIIARDKTQLTQFSGGKAAYPVYLTIGNFPKALRRKLSMKASILIAYLSVDKMDKSDLSEAEHRSKNQRVFHEAMHHVLEPLREAGREGVEMVNALGEIRQVHPILSSYIADYPEQCLVACCKYGTCPKCKCGKENLSKGTPSPNRTPGWTLGVIERAKQESQGSTKKFSERCMEEDVTGGVYRPFWKDFPLTDIHRILTPDVLHQLYQGVLKNIIQWCQTVVGEKKLDQRIRLLPQFQGVRQFRKGISALAQISGPERKDMAKILIPCLIGAVASPGLKAICGLLDFVFLAQYPTHDTHTLQYLQDALNSWNTHKQYFVNVGCHPSLNIPKFHSLLHYVDSIKFFGTTDNYNTEMFERLHIDFAKEGWRATNQRDEFPQMIRWLSRQEKMDDLLSLIEAREAPASSTPPIPTSSPQKRSLILLAKNPPAPRYPVTALMIQHDAWQFNLHLKQYLNSFLPSQLGRQHLEQATLPIDVVDVFYQFCFKPEPLHDEEERDLIAKATPGSEGQGKRFDPVVIMEGENAEATGLEGTQIGRLKIIFKLPEYLDLPGRREALPSSFPKGPLAYVEWYSRQSTEANKIHGLYNINKVLNAQGLCQGSVIPLSNIRQTCMLTPDFSKVDVGKDCKDWTPENVLDRSSHFWINNWATKYCYQTLW